jgi:hypothetical protein
LRRAGGKQYDGKERRGKAVASGTVIGRWHATQILKIASSVVNWSEDNWIADVS